MNRTKRLAVITSIAVLGLVSCGDDAKSPAPVGTEVMTDTTDAMMTDTTDAMMTDTTDAMMTDGSTTTTGG